MNPSYSYLPCSIVLFNSELSVTNLMNRHFILQWKGNTYDMLDSNMTRLDGESIYAWLNYYAEGGCRGQINCPLSI